MSKKNNIKEIDEKDIEEIDEKDIIEIDEEKILDSMKEINMFKEPSTLSNVKTLLKGRWNAYRHRTNIIFLQPFYQKKKVAMSVELDYGGSNYIALVTPEETILKMHTPKIDDYGDHNYYVKYGQRITCEPANIDKSFLYPSDYNKKSIIPDMFNKVTRYRLAEEIALARNRDKKRQILMIILAIGLGMAIHSIYSDIKGGNSGDEYTINGDYVGDKNIDTNDKNTNNTNDNGGTVIIDFMQLPLFNLR